MQYENKIEDVVALAIKKNLNIDVHRVNIETFINPDGDEMLQVEVTLSFSKRKLPTDFMYKLVRFASDAIRATGEERYPVILPYLAGNQTLAARV
ncbi:MAG: hypothetical protein COA60_005230 [Robiginitomaculum sp.]|nr:hypothetical protein [Robiginitomaculum sp.]